MERHRESLRRMVQLRLDRALGARVDASDVVQDVLWEASRRLSDYLRDAKMPFHLWLRELAKDHLIDAHRRHRKAQRRSVDRERPLAAGICRPVVARSGRSTPRPRADARRRRDPQGAGGTLSGGARSTRRRGRGNHAHAAPRAVEQLGGGASAGALSGRGGHAPFAGAAAAARDPGRTALHADERAMSQKAHGRPSVGLPRAITR